MPRFPKALGVYSTVGLELVVGVLIGLLGGRWLDAKVGTHGVFALAGFLLGVVTGFRGLWRAAKRMEREAEHADDPGQDGD